MTQKPKDAPEDFDPWENYYTEEFPSQVLELLILIAEGLRSIKAFQSGSRLVVPTILLTEIDGFIEKHNLKNSNEELMKTSCFYPGKCFDLDDVFQRIQSFVENHEYFKPKSNKE